MVKKCLDEIVVYVLTVITLVFLLILSCTISSEKIIQNQIGLVEAFQYRGVLPSVPMGQYGVKIDFWTESYYINNACVLDSKQPFYEAFANTVMVEGENPLQYMTNAITNADLSNKVERPQYWWGGRIIIRPLLYIMDYESAITLWQIVFWGIFISFAGIIYKHYHPMIFFAFMLGIYSVNLITASLIFHTSFVWVIAFLACIFIFRGKINYIRIFMLSGLFTAFFDWMSTPIITFLLPMTIMLLEKNCQGKESALEGVRKFIKAGMVWAMSYGITQVLRWGGASVILSKNVFKMGSERASQHGIMAEGSFWNVFCSDVKLCTTQLSVNVFALGHKWISENWLWIFTLLVLIFAFIVALINKKNQMGMLFSVIAVCPFVWIAVFRGWFNIHYWFAYRIFGMTILLLMLSLFYTLKSIKETVVNEGNIKMDN